MTGKNIVKAAGIITVMNLLSRILGFGREMAIAKEFGASGIVDAYLIGTTLPNLLYPVIGGALATAIIPVFLEYQKEKAADAWKIANTIVIMVVTLFLLISFVGVIGSPLIVKVLAPGFDSGLIGLTNQLTAIMLPGATFMVLASLFSGLLNANKLFGWAAFAPVLMNVFIIFSVFALADTYGITGLAYGTLIGVIAMAIIQIPVLYKSGYRFTAGFDLHHPGVKKVFSMVMPIMIGVGATQLYIAIDRMLASSLVEGSIAALNYATKVMQLPQNIFTMALAAAIFPTLAQNAAEQKHKEVEKSLVKGLRFIAMLTIPAGIGLAVLGEPIVRLLFERGSFSSQDTTMTTSALVYFAFGLFALSANFLLTRGFYAFQDSKTPIKITLVSVGLNFILSWILRAYLAHAGIALATSIAATLNTVFLFNALKRHLPNIKASDFAKSLLPIIYSSAVMAVVTILMAKGSAMFVNVQTSLGVLVQVSMSIGLSLVIYFLLLHLFKVDELIELQNMVLNKVRKKKLIQQ